MALCNPFSAGRVVLMAVLSAILMQQFVGARGEHGMDDVQVKQPPSSVDVDMQRKIDFLERYHVEKMEHSGEENLLYHLKGVSQMLKDWGLPLHVQDAGLFHSVFGTEIFLDQAIPDTDRPLIQDLIGEEAEAISWIFGNMNRQEFLEQVQKFLDEGQQSDGFVLWCTTQGDGDRSMANRRATEKCELSVSPQQIPAVAAITLANLLEQAPRFPESEMQAWYKNELDWELHLFRPFLTDKAYMDVERYLGRADMQRKIDFLERYHVEKMYHSGEENLLYHLKGVSQMLKDWGLPLHVQDAGLFHSVFGTEIFLDQAIPVTDRPLIQELIGEEADAISWIFGNMNRQEFYEQVQKFLDEGQQSDGFVLSCTTQGDGAKSMVNRRATEKCELIVSPQQIPSVAAIAVAILLEQAPRFPESEMQAWYRNELDWELYLFRPLLTDKACLDVERYLGRADSKECVNPEACDQTSLFVRVEDDLRNSKYRNQALPFPFRVFDDDTLQHQVPNELPIPDFVRVFQLNGVAGWSSLDELAKSARDVIDDNLASSGAVLFRNLHHGITDAVDFKEFWADVMESEHKGNWTYYPYNPAYNSLYRPRLGGMDTANNIASEVLLRLHNEMAYNPTHPYIVGFYCLREGIGGETMLALNKELSEKIPENVKPFIDTHGGILYDRFYFNDADSEDPHGLSWQGKTGATTMEEARQYYVDRGWKEEDISFDERGDMTINFVHPGYIVDEETGSSVWYNYQQHMASPMADGTEMPIEMIHQLQLAGWQSAYGVRLQEGDWLVMDNLRVLHGRYPYKDENPEKPRTLLVVYTE